MKRLTDGRKLAVFAPIAVGVAVLTIWAVEGKNMGSKGDSKAKSTGAGHAKHAPNPGDHKNRLQFETSPYLLQHADNPVDWYPWGEEAFKKARKEDKPIFLSIGYSTCHWCHVMEHESFEDEKVAKLMNETFVCIKVDREERPDIDNVYMTVCQMMTGGGGWPLTIIMTPDKKPFMAGTYFPKEGRWGRTGMLELVPRVGELWRKERDKVLQSSEFVTTALQRNTKQTAGEALGESAMREAYEQLAMRHDKEHGGFSRAPKFPTPHNMLFLLRHWKRTGDPTALAMVEKTLRAMRRGGIYDHVGFGFHRYSTDAHWLVPHFEKMLYDQALLVMAYAETYQATGNDEYERTAREILTYVLRDMTAPEGGFYSAEDADSEGEEGKFYLWSERELRDVLDEDEAETIIKAFNTTRGGNFVEEASGHKTGANILHLQKPLADIAADLKTTEDDLRAGIETARRNLFGVREKRIHPHKDDKILTDWNGLMIAALAKAARAFDEPEYSKAARRAVDFLLEKMRDKDGRLLHQYREGTASVPAFLDDYAFLTWGLLELYEADFDVRRFQVAMRLNGEMIERFWDEKTGGFFFTSDDAEGLLVRQKEIYDGAVPSGNSVAALNLLRLARMTGNTDFEKKAAEIGRAFAQSVGRAESAHTLLMSAVDFAVGPSHEVVIVGDADADDAKAMRKAVNATFAPNKVVLFRPAKEESPAIVELAAFTNTMTALKGKATAYVCRNFACEMPTTDIDRVLKSLNAVKRSD